MWVVIFETGRVLAFVMFETGRGINDGAIHPELLIANVVHEPKSCCGDRILSPALLPRVHSDGARATRNPTLSLALGGSGMKISEQQFRPLSYQLPPRTCPGVEVSSLTLPCMS